MNRRSFLKALGVVGGAAVAVAKLPAALFAADPPTQLFPGGFQTLTFKGIPIVFDRDCPSSRVYFSTKNHGCFVRYEDFINRTTLNYFRADARRRVGV